MGKRKILCYDQENLRHKKTQRTIFSWRLLIINKVHTSILKTGRVAHLQYLVAFEASARHSSFKAAGEELHVTASAVGQQVKSLERLLGLALFIRETREVQLTRAGEAFYQVAQDTLNSFNKGLSEFGNQFYSSSLNISMTTNVANEVVIPRLHEFKKSHPKIDLNIDTSMQLENLVSSNFDCAIRSGMPPWESCQFKIISQLSCNFLASKEYLEKNPINDYADLQGHTMISYYFKERDWQQVLHNGNNAWQQIHDAIHATPQEELYFNDYTSALKAAEQGLGVIIGAFPSTNRLIQECKLVPVFSANLPLDSAYYFVNKPNEARQESYDAIYSWLKSIFSEL